MNGRITQTGTLLSLLILAGSVVACRQASALAGELDVPTTTVLKAKYTVRQAEREVSKNELVSKIDAQKNVLALDEAKRALAQLEQDIHSHSASNKAALAISEEKRHKARLAMDQAEENIKKM